MTSKNKITKNTKLRWLGSDINFKLLHTGRPKRFILIKRIIYLCLHCFHLFLVFYIAWKVLERDV